MNNVIRKTALLLMLMSAAAGICITEPVRVRGASGYDAAASNQKGLDPASVAQYGMTPVAGSLVEDGSYDAEIISGSKYFRIESAKLTVSGGEMLAEILLDSTAYEYVYPGTAEEAAAAELTDYIACEKAEYGTSFSIPVPALDQPFSCAAFSKKKAKWYDRTLLAASASLPQDALHISSPDYGLIEDALDAYEKEHPDEVKAAREQYYSGGTAEEASRDGTAVSEEEAAASGRKEEAAASGRKEEAAATGRKEEAAATGRKDETVSSGRENETADSGQVIEVMDASVMADIPEAVPVDRADGEYAVEVTMTGGSGRAGVSSPTWLIVQDGRAFVRLLWSSTYYDYMIVNGRTYLNQTTDGGNSTFIIPVTAFDEPVEVIADTTAMGDPVEINYALTFYRDSIGSRGQIPQEAAKKVLIMAAAVIVIGGILNHIVKKRRYH